MPRETPKWFRSNITEEVSDSTLFRFSIQFMDGKNIRQVDVDMRADVGIDYTAIQQQLEDTPSEFAYWAAIYSELKMQCSAIERKIKVRRGVLAEALMKEVLQHQTKITDKQLNTVLEGDESLAKLERLLLIIQKHTGKMYFMVEAIKMKSDNLRSLAGFARVEYERQK